MCLTYYFCISQLVQLFHELKYVGNYFHLVGIYEEGYPNTTCTKQALRYFVIYFPAQVLVQTSP